MRPDSRASSAGLATAALAAFAAFILAGCGSTQRSRAAVAHTSTASNAAFKKQCQTAQTQALAILGDTAQLAKASASQSIEDKAVADADALKTTLSTMKATTDDPETQAKLEQYSATMDKFSQSVASFASGDYQAATGQLTGVGTEIGQAITGLQSLCPA